jgi:hypothetical protein
VLRKGIVLRPGVTAVALRISKPVAAKGGRMRLRLADPAGGVKTYTWSFKGRR